MHLPIKYVFNHFREGAKAALDAQIEREIQRGLAGRAASSERLEELIHQRADLVRQIKNDSQIKSDS